MALEDKRRCFLFLENCIQVALYAVEVHSHPFGHPIPDMSEIANQTRLLIAHVQSSSKLAPYSLSMLYKLKDECNRGQGLDKKQVVLAEMSAAFTPLAFSCAFIAAVFCYLHTLINGIKEDSAYFPHLPDSLLGRATEYLNTIQHKLHDTKQLNMIHHAKLHHVDVPSVESSSKVSKRILENIGVLLARLTVAHRSEPFTRDDIYWMTERFYNKDAGTANTSQASELTIPAAAVTPVLRLDRVECLLSGGVEDMSYTTPKLYSCTLPPLDCDLYAQSDCRAVTAKCSALGSEGIPSWQLYFSCGEAYRVCGIEAAAYNNDSNTTEHSINKECSVFSVTELCSSILIDCSGLAAAARSPVEALKVTVFLIDSAEFSDIY